MVAPSGRLLHERELVLVGGEHAGQELSGQPAVALQDVAERRDEYVQRVQRRAAVHPRVQVGRAGPHLDVDIERAARADREHGCLGVEHRSVEDHAGVGVRRLALDELDDRRSADLLLAVTAEADVHGQLPVARQIRGGAKQRPELALVVGDASRVEPAVAHLGLEGLAFPQLERRGRLHVEVAVAEDQRSSARVVARRDEAVDEGPLARPGELCRSAGAANELEDPVGRGSHVARPGWIGAHARDPQKLDKLGQLARGERAVLSARRFQR